MCFAEHLAIADISCSALTPRCHVVGVHFVELVYLGTHIVVTFGTFWTIRNALCLSLVGLTGIYCLLLLFQIVSYAILLNAK